MRQIEPTVMTQREAVTWQREYTGYPSGEWSLEYRFRGPGTGFNVTAAADDDGRRFTATVTAAQTAAAAAGAYQWQAWATSIADPADVRMIGAGRVNIKLGFAAVDTDNVDLRTPNRIAYDAITATLQGTATADHLEYEISTPAGSRKVKRMARTELISLQQHFAKLVKRELERERARRTGKFGTTVKVTLRGR